MNILRTIHIQLPETNQQFATQLLSFLAPFGRVEENVITFSASHPNFFPAISLSFEQTTIPTVTFKTDTSQFHVPLINQTGLEKKSPHTYKAIPFEDFQKRIEQFKLTSLDHFGCNLPWFEGLHPQILQLREVLKKTCLYHQFPTGEHWDFILPASEEEILNQNTSIDYSKARKPKFEIVSFEKSSTPLIQCDISIERTYEDLLQLFPEAIHEPELRNLWIYIENPFKVDFCLVINETSKADWSDFFKGHRLI